MCPNHLARGYQELHVKPEKKNMIALNLKSDCWLQRIDTLSENAYSSDPRIQRFKQEDKDKKAALKKAKQEAARAKQEEEERQKREVERQLQLEKEEQERIMKEKVHVSGDSISAAVEAVYCSRSVMLTI